jgi:hypothetical protein
LASVYNVVHSERGGLANDIFVQEFFKSIRNIKIQIPNKYQEVWDPSLVITFIKENWAVNKNLSLDVLQKKTIILLCLGTIWRPRSDLGRLQWWDIDFHFIDTAARPTGVTLLARAPKEGPAKVSKLGCIEDSEVCPVCTLWDYCSKA